MSREITNKILELIEDGMLDRDTVIMGCLKYMSEDEVREMAEMNELLHRDNQKPHQNAFGGEFLDARIPVDQQKVFDITYKDRVIGTYVPDLIVFDRIVVDTKVIEKISQHEVGQMMNYLKITGLQVGLIINFKHPRLEWKRIIR